jgi:peptidyl-tRNA hydrolase
MQIPQTFQLAGIKVNVVREDNLVDTRKCIGEARYSRQEIAIDTKSAPDNLTEQSFLHELVHWILYIMNEDEKRNNEQFVDTFAHLLYQYLESKVEDGEA